MSGTAAAREVDACKELVRGATATVRRLLAEANEPLSERETAEIEAFAEGAHQASTSQNDELRDNMMSAYGLAVRPTIDAQDPSHAHLRIDAAVNDLRDAILKTERAAERAGYRTSGMDITPTKPEVVPQGDMAAEAQDIRTLLKKLKEEIQRPEIRQVGLINIYVKEIGIKANIAGMIAKAEAIDLRGLGTAIAGIVRLLAAALAAVQRLTRTARRAVDSILEKAREAASRAFDVVHGVVKRVFGDDRSEESMDRIWTESEVQDLVVENKKVPREASPYVRTLKLSRSDIRTLDNIKDLKELRRLSVDTSKALDASALAGFSMLELLDLDASGNIDLSACASLPRLRHLKISTYSRTPSLLLPAKPVWRTLEKLEIEGYSISRLPDLVGAPKLVDVTLTACKLDFSQLATFLTVRKLRLNSMNTVDLEFTRNLTQIEELDLRWSGVRNLTPLRELNSLKRLKLSRQVANALNLGPVPRHVEITGDYGGMIRRRTA